LKRLNSRNSYHSRFLSYRWFFFHDDTILFKKLNQLISWINCLVRLDNLAHFTTSGNRTWILKISHRVLLHLIFEIQGVLPFYGGKFQVMVSNFAKSNYILILNIIWIEMRKLKSCPSLWLKITAAIFWTYGYMPYENLEFFS
jgi:hypothetical protein